VRRLVLPGFRPALVLAAAVAVAVALVVASRLAMASFGAGGDRSAAEAAINSLTSVPAHAKLAREPLTRAQHALRRAADARVGGDHAHGTRLEGVAREWAETGRDLVRAAEAERQALALFAKASELETKAIRGRALLEETMARRERAREKLQQLEGPQPAKEAP
jgi:hypothetical protein